MTLLVIALAVVALIVLVSWIKLNAFLAFLLVALPVGFALGLGPAQVLAATQKGLGDTLGSVVLVVVLGAILGKLVADSGAAQQIAATMLGRAGARHVQWIMLATGLIIGIPLFYNVGFLLAIPLIFSVVYQYRLPAVYVGLPMLAALSVLHGFLPPHPAPTALVVQFKANLGLTFLYGLLVAGPAVVVAGPLYARTLRGLVAEPLAGFVAPQLPAAALRKDGVALIHAIGRSDGPGSTNAWMTKYIFPGGYSPALSEVLPAVEQSGLLTTDIEILRLHYARTIAHWRRRFAANRDAIQSLYDERFCRMFEFYLVGSELAFRRMGHMNWQLQLTRDFETLPLTRDYMQEAERRTASLPRQDA